MVFVLVQSLPLLGAVSRAATPWTVLGRSRIVVNITSSTGVANIVGSGSATPAAIVASRLHFLVTETGWARVVVLGYQSGELVVTLPALAAQIHGHGCGLYGTFGRFGSLGECLTTMTALGIILVRAGHISFAVLLENAVAFSGIVQQGALPGLSYTFTRLFL